MADSVLVTRPAEQAGATGAELERAGFRPVFAPLLEIVPHPEPSAEQRRLLLDLDLFGHVIFVSRNAIYHGMSWIEDFWPQLPAGLNWYAVGAGSAARLESYGLSVWQPEAEMSSEGLLALAPLQQVAGQRVLIVKGDGGRQTLREELLRRGAKVDELAAYRRCCPDYAPGALANLIRDEAVTAILLSSGEGLNNMVSLLGEAAAEVGHLALIVPGRRVAALAREAGFHHVVEADNATDDAMLAALQSALGRDGDTDI